MLKYIFDVFGENGHIMMLTQPQLAVETCSGMWTTATVNTVTLPGVRDEKQHGLYRNVSSATLVSHCINSVFNYACIFLSR